MPAKPRHKPILITGPTASGKSGLALALAERLDGVIINSDSMQVYGDLSVLTARPDAADVARVPHRMFGHVDGSEAYSAGRFQREITAEIEAATSLGLRPIIVGGTGLYFKALLEGLSPVPAIPEDIRNHWRALAAEQGAYAMWTVLMHDDPAMALRLEPNDGQRIVRALEVFHATGKSLDHWQQQPGTPVIAPDKCVRLMLSPARDDVYARADQRFDQMMAAGALSEVKLLKERALDPNLPVMRSLGVRPLLQHLEGVLPLHEATMAAKAETRQFIKRQQTWFKGQMSAWTEVTATPNEAEFADLTRLSTSQS